MVKNKMEIAIIFIVFGILVKYGKMYDADKEGVVFGDIM